MGREKIKEVLEREKKRNGEKNRMLTFQLQFGTTGGTFIIAVHWSLPSEHPKSTWWVMVTKLAYKPVGLLSPIRITMNCVA